MSESLEVVDPDDIDLQDDDDAVERVAPQDADPYQAVASALAAWAETPDGYVSLLTAARPHVGAVVANVAAVRTALDAGDPASALSAAAESIAREADPARREALRAASAAAISALDPDEPRGLFSGANGWSAARPLCVGSSVLHLALVKGARPWESALLESFYRHESEAVRLAAIETQVMIARRMGLGPASLRHLMVALVREKSAAGRLGHAAAELIWLHDASSFIQPIFGRFGGLVAAAAEHPLLALLLRRGGWHRVPGELRARTSAGAARLQNVERATAAFWARLADPTVTVAVVGNSPCEAGLGKGPAIDAQNVVVRFNDAPEDGRFAEDYGARCDVKVLAVSHVRRESMRTSAPVVVFRRQPLIASRRMTFTAAFAGRGANVVYVPSTMTSKLRGELRRPASSGLAFLAQVRAVRGSLANVSCFGFSMTDHLAPGAVTHYFNTARTNEAHAWAAERKLFDAWTAGG